MRSLNRHAAAAILALACASAGDLDHALKPTERLKQLRPDTTTLVVVEGASHTGARGIQRDPRLVTAIREYLGRQRAQ